MLFYPGISEALESSLFLYRRDKNAFDHFCSFEQQNATNQKREIKKESQMLKLWSAGTKSVSAVTPKFEARPRASELSGFI